jgi:transposase-like protein
LLVLSDEITFLSGTGFKNTSLKGYRQRKRTKAGSEYIWLWVAIEPKNKEILGISISKERNMFVAGVFCPR